MRPNLRFVKVTWRFRSSVIREIWIFFLPILLARLLFPL